MYRCRLIRMVVVEKLLFHIISITTWRVFQFALNSSGEGSWGAETIEDEEEREEQLLCS